MIYLKKKYCQNINQVAIKFNRFINFYLVKNHLLKLKRSLKNKKKNKPNQLMIRIMKYI